jgi:hypothetical protein
MRTVRLSTCLLVLLLCAGPAAAQDQPPPAANPFGSLSGALTTEDTRLTTGVESIAASAARGQQHLLIDFMLTAPLGTQVTRAKKPVATAWFNARFNGAATQTVSGVKQFVGGFEKDLVSGDTADLLNSLTFRAGLEFRLPKMNGFAFEDYQFQPTLIAAFGVQTVPALQAPSVFEMTDDAWARWGTGSSDDRARYKYISFTEPDRRQFFRSFEFGLRLKTHHFNDCKPPAASDCSTDRRRNFPGIIDLTLGRDAAITGGTQRGIVGHIDAFYPIPTDTVANAIYFFGAIRTHWLRAESPIDPEADPVILRAPTAVVSLPSPEVFQHTLTADERTRDEWKFGIGVDLVRLFSAATAARADDNAVKEEGSIVVVGENTDALVQRRVLQPGEERAFAHGLDVMIPLQTGALQGSPIPGEATAPVSFTKDEPRIAVQKERLKNTNTGDFTMVVVRVKPRDARSKLGKFEMTTATETSLTPTETTYAVSKVHCAATCTLSSKDDVDNTIVVVPLAAATIKVDGKDAGSAKKAYEAVVVDRNTKVDVTGFTDLIVVRIP